MEELIVSKIKELTSNGKLDEMLSNEVSNFIQKTIQNIFSSYSPISKELTKKMEETVLHDFSKIDLTTFSCIIKQMIQEKLNSSLSCAIQPIGDMIDDFVDDLGKKEWLLSEIIEKFIRDNLNYDEYDNNEIAFFQEESEYGYKYIYFDEDSNTTEYSCKYRLMITKNNKMLSPTIDDTKINPVNIGNLSSFDLFLYKLYMTDCTVICDDVETNWENY